MTAEERTTICSGLIVLQQKPVGLSDCVHEGPGHLRTFLGFLGINRRFKSGKTTTKLQLGFRL